MPRSRELIPLVGHRWTIQVTDDGSRTLIDPTTRVAHHSASGAISETRHVYLNNSGAAARLDRGLSTSVLEVGLGTCMAMLVTVDRAISTGSNLRYLALEHDWLEAAIIGELKLGEHVPDRSLVDQYLRWRDSLGQQPAPGRHLWSPARGCEVVIHHGEAGEQIRHVEASFDAVYHDPFAPSVNGELWEPGFLQSLQRLLVDDGVLVTYCVNRIVRERLEAVGFRVQRVRGPSGGKREVLIARNNRSTDFDDDASHAV